MVLINTTLQQYGVQKHLTVFLVCESIPKWFVQLWLSGMAFIRFLLQYLLQGRTFLWGPSIRISGFLCQGPRNSFDIGPSRSLGFLLDFRETRTITTRHNNTNRNQTKLLAYLPNLDEQVSMLFGCLSFWWNGVLLPAIGVFLGPLPRRQRVRMSAADGNMWLWCGVWVQPSRGERPSAWSAQVRVYKESLSVCIYLGKKKKS